MHVGRNSIDRPVGWVGVTLVMLTQHGLKSSELGGEVKRWPDVPGPLGVDVDTLSA